MSESQWSISKLYSLQLYHMSIVYGLYVLRAGHNNCISSLCWPPSRVHKNEQQIYAQQFTFSFISLKFRVYQLGCYEI